MPQKRISHLFQRSLLGIVLGMIYAAAAFEDQVVLPVSAMTGLGIGLLTAWLDHYIFTGRIRRFRFILLLLIRTLSYLLVICFCIALISGIYYLVMHPQESWLELLDTRKILSWTDRVNALNIVGFSFMVILLLQYINLTFRLVGPRILWNYIIGRYHTPKEEERIFMFLDMKSSTTIAEKLGHFRWHNMLNDFFFDLAEPVSRSEGSIYQYVGDEVVISWPKKRGLRNLNCIRCFFRIKKKINVKRDRYLKKYGFEPIFKAGYHIGKVVTGEIGDYKKEIVFHGDTINTASRIQDECNRLGRFILISEDLLNELNLDGEFVEEYMGSILLRGKGREIRLFSLQPAWRSDGT